MRESKNKLELEDRIIDDGIIKAQDFMRDDDLITYEKFKSFKWYLFPSQLYLMKIAALSSIGNAIKKLGEPCTTLSSCTVLHN